VCVDQARKAACQQLQLYGSARDRGADIYIYIYIYIYCLYIYILFIGIRTLCRSVCIHIIPPLHIIVPPHEYYIKMIDFTRIAAKCRLSPCAIRNGTFFPLERRLYRSVIDVLEMAPVARIAKENCCYFPLSVTLFLIQAYLTGVSVKYLKCLVAIWGNFSHTRRFGQVLLPKDSKYAPVLDFYIYDNPLVPIPGEDRVGFLPGAVRAATLLLAHMFRV